MPDELSLKRTLRMTLTNETQSINILATVNMWSQKNNKHRRRDGFPVDINYFLNVNTNCVIL